MRRNTTTSPYIAPFFVAPKVITSTPVSATIDEIDTPASHTAFAMRAPSRCTSRSCR